MPREPIEVELIELGPENWREVAAVAPREDQLQFVAPTTYYLCLSHFGGEWNCLAVGTQSEVVGHVMWAREERTAWIGGVVIDAAHQGKGIGRAAMEALSDRLVDQTDIEELALSYQPANVVARRLYADLGFVETGETEDDEVVARRPIQ